MASALGISVKTADRHIQNAYRKIGVSTRAAATLFAMRARARGMGRTPNFPPRPSVVASSPTGEIDERVHNPGRTMTRDSRFAACQHRGSEQGVTQEKGRETMTQTEATRARLKAAIVAIAPAVLLAGFVWHPYTAVPDEITIAAAVAADTTRWGLLAPHDRRGIWVHSARLPCHSEPPE